MYYELETPRMEPTMQCRAPHYTTRVKSAVSMGNVNATGCRTQTVMNQRLKLYSNTYSTPVVQHFASALDEATRT